MIRKYTIILLVSLLPLVTLAGLPHKDSSVLATGTWHKLAVFKQGIHQITYQDMVSMGIDPATLDPATIRIFGNGSGMLSEINSGARIDDLREISVRVDDGGDGTFDQGDKVLFYGEAADKWNFDRLTRYFVHHRNLYSDTTYYYLNTGLVAGRRVDWLEPSSATPHFRSVTFEDYAIHHLDSLNVMRSGKEWFGEVFDEKNNSHDFHFSFPDLDTTTKVRVRGYVMGRSPVPSWFYLKCNGAIIDSLKIDSTDPNEFTRAGRPRFKQTFIQEPKTAIDLNLTYKLPTTSTVGWLNFLELNCSRHLVFHGPQMSFRDTKTTGPGKITEFTLHSVTPDTRVWDVTDPSSVGEFIAGISGDSLLFKRAADSLREFIAFDGSYFHPVRYVGPVANQNLHALPSSAMIIVTHPMFVEEANRLADYHRSVNGTSVTLATIEQVYNEFSCGQPDPTAIRDFVKMLYDRGSGPDLPAYLLLFGDGSYDPKNRIPGNNNLIPTFQSVESLNATSTYVTDDYFGIMGDNMGQESNGPIDIGVGRLPVSTAEEASDMVDKIIHYATTQPPVHADWRNVITLLADDEDHNLHLHQAEELASIVATKYPHFNISKIYFDSYKMISIPGGTRFPDVTTAINDAVKKGTLLLNYTGHGGESGWSFEQALTTSDIESWTNFDKLPVFVTATCEFSRFDNPERYTAGEMVILHPDGGAIALFSTTRLAFAGLNILLNTSLFEHLMDKLPAGGYVTTGDLIRLSKNDNSNHAQLRNFVLLGDPAQRIAFTGYSVKTLEINEQTASVPDTVRGMSTVKVKGVVEDMAGQKVSGYNGNLQCRVFDKPVTNTTLGNRPGYNYPEDFSMQNSLLFKGEFPVKDGAFDFSFVMPRSIALQYGAGKLSYYATDGNEDATGYSRQIIIGGREENPLPDYEGPAISMFLDTRSFISGGTSSASPTLISDLADTTGINCLGLGIGHEIELVIDHDHAHSVVLNDYYVPQTGTYTRGTLTYPLGTMEPGIHSLTLRAWDLYDNSSEKEIYFTVPGSEGITVKNVKNAPNPLVEFTNFLFYPQEMNNGGIDVKIMVYNLQGILVKTLETSYIEPAGSTGMIRWDGTDSNGRLLSSGLYPYKVIFNGRDGSYSETSQKLMITR